MTENQNQDQNRLMKSSTYQGPISKFRCANCKYSSLDHQPREKCPICGSIDNEMQHNEIKAVRKSEKEMKERQKEKRRQFD